MQTIAMSNQGKQQRLTTKQRAQVEIGMGCKVECVNI